MKRIATVLAVLMLRGGGVFAQSSVQEPHLVFSISGGLSSGGSLWTLPNHLQPVPASSPDTMEIGRVLRPGIVAGLTASYFTSPRFGWTAEVTYFGLSSEQRCAGPTVYQPQADSINLQACSRAQGLHIASSVVGFLAGATFRFFPDSPVEPFVRAVAGLGLLGNSYIETNGVVRSTQCPTTSHICTLTLLREDRASQFTFVSSLSAGISFALSPAYRVRFEGRDVIASLPVATGDGTSPSIQTGRRIKHIPTFTFGLDIILERRHARRY